MYNEEEGQINFEVESDESIQVIDPPEIIPTQQPEISKPEIRKDQNNQPSDKQTADVSTQQATSNQQQTQENNEEQNQLQLDEEQMLRRPYALRWKKKSIKKLEKITSKITEEDMEEIKQSLSKKVNISEPFKSNNINDVMISGSINRNQQQQFQTPLQKQKQFQVLVEHFANQPDFLEAIMAQEQQPDQNVENGILKKPMMVPPKSGLKKQPGRKKAGVQFADQQQKEQPNTGGIQYVKTSVLPQKAPPPPPQPTQQIQNILSKFQEYREIQNSNSKVVQQEQSEQPLGTGAWYPNKVDRKSQPFIPPYAGQNPRMLPTISSTQSQAPSSGIPQKLLSMNQNQPRRESSPKRTREFITEQYTSEYQVDKPPVVPSRQQPIFQQQMIEKNVNFELNQAKRNQSSMNSMQQQILRESQIKVQPKMQESVKRQSIHHQLTLEENSQDFCDNDLSQEFMEFKKAGKLIQTTPPQDQCWQEVLFNTDIPKEYYMNEKFITEYPIQINATDPIDIFKLFIDQSIIKFICNITNKKQCIKIDEDILESFITALIFQFYIQLSGMREIRQVKFDHIIDSITFGHICKDLQIDEMEDFSIIFEKVCKNFKVNYNPEEFLTLDKPIFFQNRYVENLLSLSDGMKGYILDFLYEPSESKIFRSLQKYHGKSHKLYLGPDVASLSLIAQLKSKQFGTLAKLIDKQTLLSKELMQQVKDNARNGKSSQFISNDHSTIMLIYSERQQHLQQVEGYISTFADFTRLKPGETKIKDDANKPIILYLYDKITTQHDKRGKTYQYCQVLEKGYNLHLDIFLQLLYSSIFNANILNKLKNYQGQQFNQEKTKQLYLDFVRQLLHQFYIKCFKRRGITQFPSNHTLEAGDTGIFNCIQCGEQSTTVCRECSNHMQMIISVCRNKNDRCLKYHQEMFINQPKLQGTNRKLTNQQAIVKFEYYRSQIQQSKDQNAMEALPVIEDTLKQLEALDPNDDLSMGIQTLLVSLSDMIQRMFLSPNIVVSQKNKQQDILTIDDPQFSSVQQLGKQFHQIHNEPQVIQKTENQPAFVHQKVKANQKTQQGPNKPKFRGQFYDEIS